MILAFLVIAIVTAIVIFVGQGHLARIATSLEAQNRHFRIGEPDEPVAATRDAPLAEPTESPPPAQ